MISFGVKLIRVPPVGKMSGWDVFTLMVNARHVAGDFWCYEGDLDAIGIAGEVELVAEGETPGHGDMSDQRFRKHCEEIFGVDLRGEPPAWKMSVDMKRTK